MINGKTYNLILIQLKCYKDNVKRILYIIIFNLVFLNHLQALIEVDITRGNLDPLPIAVSPLHVDIKSENYEGIKIKDLGSNISKILKIILEEQDCLIR